MADVFHLALVKEMLQGATVAILPGDPLRVEKTARRFSDPVFLAENREFTSWLGFADNVPIIVCSTGIGGPSTSIAVEELAQLGVRTFLRVGTSGAIQPNINIADVVISQGAVRLDGASSHFAPMEYPAVSNFQCTRALVDAAIETNVPYHVGITVSSDTFYPGQERYDTATGKILGRFHGSVDMWQELGASNFEMESATLFTMCASQGWRAGSVAGILVNRHIQETPDNEVHGMVESHAIDVVVAAAKKLI
jgi:uridine phosphorylase